MSWRCCVMMFVMSELKVGALGTHRSSPDVGESGMTL